MKLGSYPENNSTTLEIEMISLGSASIILGNKKLYDVIRGTVKSFKGVSKYGVESDIIIVKIDEVVVIRSGRVPTTFIWYVPKGFYFKTVILPVTESTLK